MAHGCRFLDPDRLPQLLERVPLLAVAREDQKRHAAACELCGGIPTGSIPKFGVEEASRASRSKPVQRTPQGRKRTGDLDAAESQLLCQEARNGLFVLEDENNRLACL